MPSVLPIHSIHFGTNPPIHHTLKKLTSPSIERRHSPKFSQALMTAFQATTSRCTSARCMVSRRLKASGHRLPALESGGFLKVFHRICWLHQLWSIVVSSIWFHVSVPNVDKESKFISWRIGEISFRYWGLKTFKTTIQQTGHLNRSGPSACHGPLSQAVMAALKATVSWRTWPNWGRNHTGPTVCKGGVNFAGWFDESDSWIITLRLCWSDMVSFQRLDCWSSDKQLTLIHLYIPTEFLPKIPGVNQFRYSFQVFRGVSPQKSPKTSKASIVDNIARAWGHWPPVKGGLSHSQGTMAALRAQYRGLFKGITLEPLGVTP